MTHLSKRSASGSKGLLDCGDAGWEQESAESSSSSSEGVASSARPSGGGSPSPPSPKIIRQYETTTPMVYGRARYFRLTHTFYDKVFVSITTLKFGVARSLYSLW